MRAARQTQRPRRKRLALGIRGRKLNRTELIQRAVDSTGRKDYLEVGVETGKTIKSIVCKNKIGVDPNFLFDIESDNPDGADFFEETSDEYFRLHSRPIDGVIYVDGLHTYEQSLRDIENSILVMSPGSIILLDDCFPRNSSEARPAKSHAEAGGGSWCGDVWKSVAHLRSKRIDLNIFTLLDGPGLAVITIGKPVNKLNLNGEIIENLDYSYFEKHSKTILNIKSEDYYLGFLEGRKQRFES